MNNYKGEGCSVASTRKCADDLGHSGPYTPAVYTLSAKPLKIGARVIGALMGVGADRSVRAFF